MYQKIMTSCIDSIIFRLILISFVGIIAIWANHEASKGFTIAVVNDAGKYTFARKHFSIFFESNDKATRIMLNTSRFVENLLYPIDQQDSLQMKKQINSVTLRLAPTNLPANMAVHLQKPNEYLINLSPSLLEASNYDEPIVEAVLQGMARVWLWDGDGKTPQVLLNGIVEYISSLAGFTVKEPWKSTMWSLNNEICWKDDDPSRVAGFLRYSDQTTQVGGGGGGGGQVLRRLNDGMRNSWIDGMMDDALGMPRQHACASYNMMIRRHHLSSSM